MPISIAVDTSNLIDGTNADVNDVLVPLANLKTAIENTLNGLQEFEKFSLGSAVEVTISGGVIAYTNSYHKVDTEGNAAIDDLTTISGGSAGKTLWLRLENASRQVVLKHGTGNIFLSGSEDVTLETTATVVHLLCIGAAWVQIGGAAKPKVMDLYGGVAINAPTLNFPRGIIQTSGQGTATNRPFAAVQPASRARLPRWIVCANTSFDYTGLQFTLGGGPFSNSNDSDAPYVNIATGSVINNTSYAESAYFNLVQWQHNPSLSANIRVVDITNISLYILFCSAAVIADTGSGAHLFGFRFSTTAGDVNWMGWVGDSANYSTVDTGVVAAAGAFKLLCWADANAGIAYFSVNDSTPVTINTNLPSSNQNLGVQARIVTRAAAAKNFKLSRLYMESD